MSWIAGVTLAGAWLWALAYGPLIPWSPVKPGYRTLTSARAEVSFPRGAGPGPALPAIDGLVDEAERFHRMRAPGRLRILECANWEDFARFCPFAPGRGVGAVTLDLGGVIYLSPRLKERGLDNAEFLRHELSHAIVAENVTLWNLRKIRRHTWLYEGVPVWFGRQRSYVSRDEFLQRASLMELQPVMDYDAGGAAPAPVEMRFAYVAWRNFIEYLVHTHGLDTFHRFFGEFLARPDELEGLFAAAFGQSRKEAVERFQSAIRRREFVPPE